MAGDKMLYVSKENESVVKLAAAIARHTNTSFSSLVGHALRRYIRYAEKFMPDAVKRAREEAGVWS